MPRCGDDRHSGNDDVQDQAWANAGPVLESSMPVCPDKGTRELEVVKEPKGPTMSTLQHICRSRQLYLHECRISSHTEPALCKRVESRVYVLGRSLFKVSVVPCCPCSPKSLEGLKMLNPAIDTLNPLKTTCTLKPHHVNSSMRVETLTV